MKKHPYIIATVAAILLAIVVWRITPKEYSAIVKLSDEYKETDLAIGLNAISVQIRDAMGTSNEGLNNMEVYCKVLDTKDFARSIAQKQVPGKGMCYGAYLGDKDTVGTVQKHLAYNFDSKQETLIISFTDKDALVAAQMLDSTVAQLQSIVTDYRHTITAYALQNAGEELKSATQQFKEAQHNYSTFTDEHLRLKTAEMDQAQKSLQNELDLAKKHYEDAAEQYIRQAALSHRSYLSFATIQDITVPQQSNNHFVGYLLCFLSITLVLARGLELYRRNKKGKRLITDLGDRFSPWTITIAIWALIISLYYILDTDLYPITSQFYICLAIWVPIFCVCSIVTYNLLSGDETESHRKDGIDFNKAVFNFFFVISMIITPLYVYQVWQIVTMFSVEDLMSNVRMLAIYGEGQGFLNYSNVINQSLFVVALWAHPKVPMWQVVALTLACLLNSLAIMEKGSMFFVFFCITFVLFEKRIIHFRSIVLSSALLIGFFYIFNLARAEQDSDYQQNETLLDFFAMYALSPPVAFCQLNLDVTPQFGTNTFGNVYIFLERFGISGIVLKDKLQDFVWVPIPTNIYTVFQPFYMDFGYKGIAYFAGLYGVVSGWLYRLFRSGNGVGCCLYTFAAEVLVLQFYQENVLLSLVFVLQFTFFVVLFAQKKIALTNILART